MKIFLAGNIALGPPIEYIKYEAPFVLQTYYDLRHQCQDICKAIINTPKMFFLDSGAFTFMNSGKSVDFEKYLEEYAEFIKKYDVTHFFELDLDTIIGVTKTREMTDRLEKMTGKQCIPVFHACRKMSGWREMVDQYPYVAIGSSGITEECRWVHNSAILNQMLAIAHKAGCKVHGLGYTRLSNINKTTVHFDSVDSSSCLSGGRFATIYKFTGQKLISKNIKGKSSGYKALNDHNIQEWIKMCRYKDGIK